MTKIKGTEEQELLQMIIWPPLFLCKRSFLCKWSFLRKWSFFLQMTKIKGMGENGLLQMTIWIIWPSLFCLQMVFCKEDGPPDPTNIFLSDGAEIHTRPAPHIEDPQYKISAQTDQRFKG